ncbi:L-serine ammonia-lyase [Streptomyces venezuelae]
MSVSVLDLFSIGVGPSSSHTVGPMRAAGTFVQQLKYQGLLSRTAHVRVELFGSLGATGRGHHTPSAVLWGLMGHLPETVDPQAAREREQKVHDTGRLLLQGTREIDFPAEALVLHQDRSLPFHANGMRFFAHGDGDVLLWERTYYSVGGGFVLDEDEACADPDHRPAPETLPYPCHTGRQLLETARRTGLPVSSLMLGNELTRCSEPELRDRLARIWQVMEDGIDRGLAHDGILPGGLNVRRRAASIARKLRAEGDQNTHAMEWATAYAMAVSEENATGGRVVTAPTNGAAGILPAVGRYFLTFAADGLSADERQDVMACFLLTAGAFGLLLKENASLSGAEVGCQGEVGSACAMAAAGLAEVLGGSPEQVENAAEIGLEHHLGLTCDPVGGLVQIPCIERNAMAAVKAITAARLALRGTGEHRIGFDEAMATMKQTGADMPAKYRETSRGGLAINFIPC